MAWLAPGYKACTEENTGNSEKLMEVYGVRFGASVVPVPSNQPRVCLGFHRPSACPPGEPRTNVPLWQCKRMGLNMTSACQKAIVKTKNFRRHSGDDNYRARAGGACTSISNPGFRGHLRCVLPGGCCLDMVCTLVSGCSEIR